MNPEASQPAFTAQERLRDGRAEVAIAGELDIATVGILQQVLDALLARGYADLRLNASALTFLDAAGIGCLIRVRQRALDVGGSLRVESSNGSPLRVLEICDPLRALTNEATITRRDAPVRASAHVNATPHEQQTRSKTSCPKSTADNS
jgi:anti-anti-sigma factor